MTNRPTTKKTEFTENFLARLKSLENFSSVHHSNLTFIFTQEVNAAKCAPINE